MRLFAISVACYAALVTSAFAGPINILLDYTYDSAANGGANFFDPATPNGLAARNTLALAARTFSDRFRDQLTDITPGPTPYGWDNTWTARFTNPDTGAKITITDPVIPANTMVVYAGARALIGNTLGIGGPGAYSASGTDEFLDNVHSRGQSGVLATPATDFATWGGAITFSTTANWNFSSSLPNSTQNDFLSVATHEMAHLLGFGTADSFKALTLKPGMLYTGAKSTALYGQDVPLDINGAHWAQSVNSKVGNSDQNTAMSPSITQGTRKRFTVLDFAGIADLGWKLAGAGDANADGKVNADDYFLIDQGYIAQTQGWLNGDFNNDGMINADDYFLIDQAFIAQPGHLSSTSPAPIPEPSGLFVATIGALSLLLRLRHRPGVRSGRFG